MRLYLPAKSPLSLGDLSLYLLDFRLLTSTTCSQTDATQLLPNASQSISLTHGTMGLPPGPRYLLRQIPQLAIPPLLAFGFLRVLSTSLSSPPPLYARVLAFVLSWPLAFIVLVQWRARANRRNAAARDAVMPPSVEHKLPGSIDLLIKMFETDKAFYLGELSPELCSALCVLRLAGGVVQMGGARRMEADRHGCWI